MFVAQDAQARHSDLVAAKGAGLVHLLHQSPGQSPPPVASPGDSEPPASRGLTVSPSMPEAAARANLRARIWRAFDRWATRSQGTHRASGCQCAACVPDTVRSDDDSRPLNAQIVRYR